jgi:bifunctional oligoribonuclease and PAP phosphatase NrnA
MNSRHLLTPHPYFMHKFSKEFSIIQYVIKHSSKILLFAHTSPDADTVGSVLALKEYMNNLGKSVDVTCLDSLPSYLESITSVRFLHPDHLNLSSYEVFIACDSVERGFDRLMPKISPEQVTVLLDHHPDISIKGDVNIIDPSFSSVCEIIYDYFEFNKIKIAREVATFLMIGILGDTGNFQHANTTSRVLEIASDLMKKGASLSKITEIVFANKKMSTLKLWGKAFEKAKINPKNGMIITAITQNDLKELDASPEDIAQVASILTTVPGTKFALVLSERGDGIIKGSLRSEDYKDVDVSEIAHRFGGGGHKLASGFKIQGKIAETENGWKII